MTSVCVFCGSASGLRAEYTDAARAVGRALAARNLALVYGGGRVGLMGHVAQAALAANGTVIGVIPHALAKKEIAQEDCTELIVVDTMHERKALMADRAGAFVALPGGFGTLDELFEVLTLVQTGKAKRVPIVLFGSDYWRKLINLDVMIEEGTISPNDVKLFTLVDTPEAAWEAIRAFYEL